MDYQSAGKDLSAFRPGLMVQIWFIIRRQSFAGGKAGCTCIGGKGMLLWQVCRFETVLSQ